MKLADEINRSGNSKKDEGSFRSSGSSVHVPGGVRKELIKKFPVKANLEDYEATYANFSWDHAKKDISWFADNKVNAAFNAVDRHMNDGRRNKVALYSVNTDNQLETFTFQDIYYLSNRLGNALKDLGVSKGDRVFIFLPRIAELYISTIAISKIGAVIGPLFSAFGPDALRDRLENSGAKVVITTKELKPKLDEIRDQLPELEYVIVVNGDGDHKPGDLSYEEIMVNASEHLSVAHMDPEDPLYLLYTSGTTGKAKGIIHVHNDIVGLHATTRWVLDLRDDDVYWCTADPGWVTGTAYGIFGPWSNGISVVAYEGRFGAPDWYQLIDRLHVTVWYTAPTALRMLMKAGIEEINNHSLDSLRHIASVGEPLNPEVIRWAMTTYGLPIHDNWWQTETGMQLVANLPSLPVKPGSMGKPLPGIYATVVDDDGNELAPGQLGRLVVRPGWPSMLRQVWRNEEKFNEYFRIPGWYFSGDNAWKDEDGYLWFVGRADDVINTAGHRVGPFEVESALVEHESVAEAAVIGKPDEERGEVIKAFIVLNNGFKSSPKLIEDIKEFTKRRLAAHAYPREIEVRDTLPKTRSGKIMRRLLKAWELGLPTGDTSSLDED